MWCVCLTYGVSVSYVVCVFNIWYGCVISGVSVSVCDLCVNHMV